MSANVVPEVLKGNRMSEETVKALSSFKDEPGWLTEKRLGAWRAFEALPMPTLRDEAWRYTDISDVSPEDFSPYLPSPDVSSEGVCLMLFRNLSARVRRTLPCSCSTTLRRRTGDRRRTAEQGRRLHRPAHRSPGARRSHQGAPLRARAGGLRQVLGAFGGAIRGRVVPARAARRTWRCRSRATVGSTRSVPRCRAR